MPWKISAEKYKQILNAEGCNITKVAKRLGCTRQYAWALIGHLGLEIKKTAISKKTIRKAR